MFSKKSESDKLNIGNVESSKDNMTFGSSFLIILLLILSFFIYNSIYILDLRQMSIVMQFGNPVHSVTEPGLKFKVPFIQNVVFFDKRIQSIYFSPEGSNREVMAMDQKTMKLTAYAKYRITDPLLFYEKVRNDSLFQRNMIPIIESTIREVVGTFTFSDILNTKRAEVIEKIKKSVRKQGETFGVEIVDVAIVRINLPDKAKEAVYNRMRTDRAKEAMEIRATGSEESAKIRAAADREKVIIVAEAKGRAEMIQGEGDGKALDIVNKAVSDPEFFKFYKYMNAYKNSITNDNTSFVLSMDSDFLKYFNSLK